MQSIRYPFQILINVEDFGRFSKNAQT